MNKYTGVFLILLLVYTSSAQQGRGRKMQGMSIGTIVGNVIASDTKKALPYANIFIKNVKDDKTVTGAIGKPDGSFKVEKIPAGKFYAEVKFIGYSKKIFKDLTISPKNTTIDLGTITLEPSVTRTGTAVVTAERERVEFKIDKKVVNISTDIAAQGKTAAEALENVPSINVDVEGNVSLRGSSNFTVFIDGRPSVLDGNEILQQLPASAIDNIEIITNPTAKYDPDGMAGIINVITKKDMLNGLSGLLNVSAGTGDKYNTDLTLSYRTNTFEFFGGFDWSDNNFDGNGEMQQETYYTDSTVFRQNIGERLFARNGTNGKFGVGINITDATNIKLEGNIGTRGFERNAITKASQYSDVREDKYYYTNDNNAIRDRDYYSTSLDFLHKFDETGHQLTGMVYYSAKDAIGTDYVNKFTTDQSWQNKVLDYQTKSIEDEEDEDYRFKLDYSLPLSETDKFESGWQGKISKDIENYTYYNLTDGDWIVDDMFTNVMDFKLNIQSLYATYSGAVSDFGYQLGLRGEYTKRTIDVAAANKVYTIDRLDVFPTLHMSQKIGKKDQILASYSRRINRPRGRDLDPFPSFIDDYNIRIGNPELEPEYVNSMEVGYQKMFEGGMVSVESFYRLSENLITRTIQTNTDEPGVFYHTTSNLDKSHTAGLELMTNYAFTPWFNLNLTGSYFYYKLDGTLDEDDAVNKSTNSWNLRAMGNFILSKTTRVQFNTFYNGPSVSAQGDVKGFFDMSASLRQDFLDRKLTLALNARSIIGSMKHDFTTNGVNYYTHNIFEREAPVISLSLSYRFNNYKQEKDKNSNGGDGMDMDY